MSGCVSVCWRDIMLQVLYYSDLFVRVCACMNGLSGCLKRRYIEMDMFLRMSPSSQIFIKNIHRLFHLFASWHALTYLTSLHLWIETPTVGCCVVTVFISDATKQLLLNTLPLKHSLKLSFCFQEASAPWKLRFNWTRRSHSPCSGNEYNAGVDYETLPHLNGFQTQ